VSEYKAPLVSIVTPCFNGENKIVPFFESVLAQTYENIELIFVNDGSEDKTEDICKEYEEKFNQRDIKFIYVFQCNRGQAAAINNGLKYVRGKYLTWPDSDDLLHPDYLEKKITFLENHPDLNMVISPIRHVTERGEALMVERRKRQKEDNLFCDLINGMNCYYPPGGYLITTEAFFQAYPEKTIIESPVGQNVQMLLPIAYMSRYGYIDDCLYDYVVYEDSHAHRRRTFEQALNKSDMTSDLFLAVMKQMNLDHSDYNRYAKMVEHERYRRHFYYSIQYKKKEYMNESYKLYKQTGSVLPKIWLLHIVRRIKW